MLLSIGSMECFERAAKGEAIDLWDAFDWENTPQGYRYWSEVCRMRSLPESARATVNDFLAIYKKCIHIVGVSYTKTTRMGFQRKIQTMSFTGDVVIFETNICFSDANDAILFKLSL